MSDDERPFEQERDVSRDDAGTVLRRLGDGVAAGTVRLGGEGGVRVEVPARLELEVEFEPGDERELEVELTWGVDGFDGETDAEPADRAEPAGSDGHDESAFDPADLVTLADPGVTDATGSDARFELYRDRADEWRWRLVHRNGNVIADGGQGYARKAGARKGLESVARNAPGAPVVEEE